MPDCPHCAEPKATRPEILGCPADLQDVGVIGAQTHWVSARMSVEPEALFPAATADTQVVQQAVSIDAAGQIEALEPEVPVLAPAPGTHVIEQAVDTDLISQIESLRRDLAAARADDDASERGMAMPQFLRDPPPKEAGADGSPMQDSRGKDQNQVLREELREEQSDAPVVRPRRYGAVVGWSMTALGAMLLIAGIAHFRSDRVSRTIRVAEVPRVEEGSPQPRLNFVGADTCAGKPCETLLNVVSQAVSEVPTQTTESAGPGIVYTTGIPAVGGDAYPMLDPVDTVTIRGLPPGVRLSVGQRISDSDWAFALGDLRDVDIVVPNGQTDPIRAEVEIKMRDGRDIALFGLNIQHDPPAAVAASGSGGEGGVSEPAGDRQASEPAPAPARTAKTKAPRTKIVKQKLQAAAAPKTKGPAAPRGLIQAQQGTASAPATSAPPPVKWALPSAAKATPPPETAPVASFAGQPEASSADQPPGFETLMTLGGGFALQKP